MFFDNIHFKSYMRRMLCIRQMKQFLDITIIIVLLTVSVAVSAQTRRAIVVGIGEQEDMAWGKINGDKDVPFVE